MFNILNTILARKVQEVAERSANVSLSELRARLADASPVRGFANANVDLIREEMTDPQMARLYAETDCFLFPSYGEGQGLPPLV